MVKDSFVMHREYIEDLPEEYKAKFALIIIEYGFNGIEPELTGLEKTVWLKIKRRIDIDNETYNAKCKNLALYNEKKHLEAQIKKAGSQEEKKMYLEELVKVEALINKKADTEPYGADTEPTRSHTERVIDNDIDIEFVIDTDSVNDIEEPAADGLANSVNSSSSFINTNINNWFNNNAPNVKQKARVNIIKKLEVQKLNIDFLDYCLDLVREKAQTERQLTAYLVKAVLDWPDVLQDFNKLQKAKTATAPKIKKLTIPPPTNCTSCGAGLVYDYGTNSYYCRTCHITQELKNGKWQAAV